MKNINVNGFILGCLVFLVLYFIYNNFYQEKPKKLELIKWDYNTELALKKLTAEEYSLLKWSNRQREAYSNYVLKRMKEIFPDGYPKDKDIFYKEWNSEARIQVLIFDLNPFDDTQDKLNAILK